MLDLKFDWLKADEIENFKETMNSEEFLNFEKLGVKESDLISTRIYVVRVGNDVIGYFGLEKFESHTCCICFFYVKKELRGKGFGKRILKKIICEILNDTPYVYGLVDINNTIALNFYKKHFDFLIEIFGRRMVGKYNEAIMYVEDNCYEVVFKNE